MNDQKKFWETLQEIPSDANVQDLIIHLSEFIPDQADPDQPSEQNKDQQ